MYILKISEELFLLLSFQIDKYEIANKVSNMDTDEIIIQFYLLGMA